MDGVFKFRRNVVEKLLTEIQIFYKLPTTNYSLLTNTMKFSVIKTGGKQYLVSEGDQLSIEKIEGKEGKKISFNDVLLAVDGKKVEIGQPTLSKKVEVEIVRQYRDKKVTVRKYKNKTRYMKTKGHRQHKTEILIKNV